jgi:hypothetical protein
MTLLLIIIIIIIMLPNQAIASTPSAPMTLLLFHSLDGVQLRHS